MTLRQALLDLEASGLKLHAVSRFFSTPCFPAGAGPDYVNAVTLVQGEQSPEELLDILHTIEHKHGRARKQRWGMRTLDLDILFFGDAVLPDPQVQAQWRDLPSEQQLTDIPGQLILPHPRLQDRAFVLVPLCDVAPNWVHPLLGKSAAEMCAALQEEDIAAVHPL